MKKLGLVASIVLVGLLAARSAPAAHAQETLSNELFAEKGEGFGPKLSEAGYTFHVTSVNDLWGNTVGGNNRGAGVVGNLNTIFEVDTTKAGWWDDGTFLVWGLFVYGRQPSNAVGDYQFTSSIDSFETFEAYEATYEHRFADDSISVIVGLKDFSREFATLSYGFALVNSSFYSPPTITQIPYSFYPTTGLGAEVAIELTERTYLMAGVFDGKPSDGRLGRSRNYGVSASDGAYYISEVGYQTPQSFEPHTKVALGGWYTTGEFTDVNERERNGNFGSYLLGERQLWAESEGSNEGLGAFAQFGQAAEDRNFNSLYLGAGLHYRGLIPCREQDALVFGFNLARVSSPYRDRVPDTESAEVVYEVSYRASVFPYLVVTPDVQYVHNPSAKAALDDALIVYLRTEILL